MPTINPQAVRGPVTAIPVVAGTGVRLVEDVPNNRVVAEVDETVLWSGSTAVSLGGEYNLSEDISHFERVAVYASRNPSTTQAPIITVYDLSANHNITFWAPLYTATTTSSSIYVDAFGGTFANSKFTVTGFVRKEIKSTDIATNGGSPLSIVKIVGINRVASA